MDANTKIIHVPKHTDDNFTVESWYATITGPDRDYAGLKIGLIDLLVSEGDGFDLYTAEVQDLDGISAGRHSVEVEDTAAKGHGPPGRAHQQNVGVIEKFPGFLIPDGSLDGGRRALGVRNIRHCRRDKEQEKNKGQNP